jgi:nucleotide-binding universal stress UspA family protein
VATASPDLQIAAPAAFEIEESQLGARAEAPNRRSRDARWSPALKDLLLHIDGYPAPTAQSAIDQAVAFAAALDARVSALAVAVLFDAPGLATLLGLRSALDEEQRRSAQACEEALAYFRQRAGSAGVLGQALLAPAPLNAAGDLIAERARTRDLCLVPLGAALDGQGEVAQAVVFAAGRPALVFHPDAAPLAAAPMANIVLAWDNSRAAARAMADAMPLLEKSGRVRVLTVLGDKAGAQPGCGADAVRHLTARGVNARAEEIEVSGSAHAALEAYLERTRCDLLVMGAFGKSNIRDFVLGGLTEHVLASPKVAVLLSH